MMMDEAKIPDGLLNAGVAKMPDYMIKALRQASAVFEPPEVNLYRPPTQGEQHAFESAERIVTALQKSVDAWHQQTAITEQLVILIILMNGTVIELVKIQAASHHALWIEGRVLADNTPCFLMLHQSAVQILGFVQVVEPAKKRYPIGFVHSPDTSQVGGSQDTETAP
jgi:hypothetical protein